MSSSATANTFEPCPFSYRLAALAWILSFGFSATAQERSQARSMVISTRGIVATSHTLASQAGAAILARGGSALDAAIAANAVLNVVEIMSNGIGGDLFLIYREAGTGRTAALNASGWSPKGLTIERLRKDGHDKMPETGIHSVTVPGCVEGWRKAHRRFGRLPWAILFQPAIYYARNGYPLTEIIKEHWQAAQTRLESDSEGRRLFLPNGKAPSVGELYRNTDLADTFQVLAEQGADAFYRGPIGRDILRTSDRLGGTMTRADLAEFEAEWVEPISTSYRGWKISELPPNGQGMAALEMLNIMENFPLPSLPFLGPDALHIKMEAQKLAYQDLFRFLGDPRFARIPLSGLLSKAYARDRSNLIDRNRANCRPMPGSPTSNAGDTIYLAVVDGEGNIASLIQSLYMSFGSGIVVEGRGFHLQNRGALFEMNPPHPNALAPRKRPFHTIIPALMEKGEIHIGFGIMGGLNQAQAHAQFVSHIVDHGMNIQAALEAPRFTKATFGGCDVRVERRFPKETLDALSPKGHELMVLGDYSSWMGGGQAVLYDSSTKVKFGASSPRRDGAAVPEPHPYFDTKTGRK